MEMVSMISVAIPLLVMTPGNIRAIIKIHTISHRTNLKVMVKISMAMMTTLMVMEAKVQEASVVDQEASVVDQEASVVDMVDIKRMLMSFLRRNPDN
jgi:hypothetical protein